MKIAIDISALKSAHRARGVGVYTKNLIDALAKYGKKHTYAHIMASDRLPKDVDIVHYPYFDPFFLTLPFVKPKLTVVTVHDLIPLVFPEKFPAGIRGAIKWQIQRASLRGSSRILADSDASKNDIARITGIHEWRIDTVFLAPDPVFRPVTDPHVLAGIQKKFSLPKQYILYVGDVNWNKNIPGLLSAFQKIQKNVKLVLVGSAFIDTTLKETKEINKITRALDLDASIIRTGYVPGETLSALYSLASCLVLPSLYEGFGLPVLEAMACGCPVVSSNASSLKEIAGPAICVSPSPEDLARGINHVLNTDRNIQTKKQFGWVAHFTWKKTAQETIQSYEKVLGTL